ncbi:AEC family transporter [Colwellia sp. MEBiC06753]
MNIFTIVSPLLLLALLGYIIDKKQWLNQTQIAGLSKLTFAVFLPAFLFYRMATADLDGQLQPQLFMSFYLPVLVTFAIGFVANFLWHKQYRQNYAASATFALGGCYSNIIIVGLPLLLLVMGDQALPIVFMIVAFHSAMLFTITSAIACVQKTNDDKPSRLGGLGFIKHTIKNPLVLAILTGLSINLTGLSFPQPVATTLEMLSKPAIPLALIALGTSIAKYSIKGERTFIAIACILKLAILPAIVYLTTSYLLNVEPFVVKVLVIMSACPTGVNAYLIAQVHEVHRKAVASTVVASTVASIITLPCWLIFLGL